MKRAAFAGALAACAGLFLLSTVGVASSNAQRKPGAGVGVTTCDAEAYVNDPDPRGMNVRSGPGSNHGVIGNLPTRNVDGIVVHITGSQGDWIRIDRADESGSDEERILFSGVGWVYGPLLGVDGVGGLSPRGTPLYAGPTTKGRVLIHLPVDGGGAVVRGCQGRWMYVEHKRVRGWAAPGTLCANPLTNCS